MSDIPQDVILALAYARNGGEFNMIDRANVIGYVFDADPLEGEGFFDPGAAGAWLQANSNHYMEALEAMGEHVAKQREASHARG